jgi:hypothetical protein
MKMRSMLVALAAGIALWPAGAAVAQLPDVPGIGAAQDQVGSPRTPRAPANASAGLPGSGALPVDTSRAPARGTGTGSPTRLPETGVDTTALALDAVTLLGAGTVLLAIRRRLATSS